MVVCVVGYLVDMYFLRPHYSENASDDFRLHYAWEIWKCSVFPFRSTIHTIPSGKWSFLKKLFQLKEIENAGFVF